MKQALITLAVAFLGAMLFGRVGMSHSDRPPSACLPLDSLTLDVIRFIVQDPDPARDSLPVPRMPDSAIEHVLDANTCAAAAQAAAKAWLGDSSRTIEVEVYQLGSDHFAVVSPELVAGEFTAYMFFTREWKYLGAIAS